METTILYWGHIGRMEKKMGSGVQGLGGSRG